MAHMHLDMPLSIERSTSPRTPHPALTCVLCIRTTSAEAEVIRVAAGRSGKTLSEYGREILVGADEARPSVLRQ